MKNASGFSLVEVMIALVILAVGLTGLLGFTTQTLGAARNNEKWTTARIIAVNTAEELSSRNFNDLQSLAGNSSTATGTSTTRMNGQTYTVSWQYDRMGGMATDPLHIRVTVTFPGQLGRPMQIDTIRYTLL